MKYSLTAIGIVLGALVIASSLTLAGVARAANIVVDGQDDIFLAGQSSVPTGFPFNSQGNPNDPTDLNGAGLLPQSFAVTAGEVLTISATGEVSCCYGNPPPDLNGPDGGGLGGTADITGYGNVAGYVGPELALVGLFDGPTTPWSIMVIGSNDVITVPTGATELYLGVADALGFDDPPGYYNDNTGSFSVDIQVPEPGTLALFGAGLLGLAWFAALGRRKLAAVR